MKTKDFLPSRLEKMTDNVPLQTSWQWLVNYIKSDVLKSQTESYRQRLAQMEATDDADERKVLKDQLSEIKRRTGGFFPHATFRGGRRIEHVADVSNHVMIDLDKIPADRFDEVRQRLAEWEHTFLLYTTYSGRGLRVIVRIDDEYSVKQFRRVWTMVNDQVERLCGVKADRQCGDITRFSGLAWDPEVVFNPTAVGLRIRNFELGVLSCPPLADDELSNYELPTQNSKFKTQNSSFDVIVERVKRMVEANGCYYQEGHHNEYIANCMYLMNKFGVSESEAMSWALREFSDYSPRSVRSTVSSCYRKTAEHGVLSVRSEELRSVRSEELRSVRSEEGGVRSENANSKTNNSSLHTPHSSLKNTPPSSLKNTPPSSLKDTPPSSQNQKKASPTELRLFLSDVADFRLNVISGQTEVCWRGTREWNSLEDRDVASLWMRMAEQDMRTTTQTIRDIVESDFTPKFNPFKSYFESLPQWDGNTDHLALLADRIHLVGETADERQRLRMCLKRWLIAMVAGIFEPQTINHEKLVLLGKQGNYKSTFFSMLLPPPLQRYFYTRLTVMSKDKDDLLTLSQYALIAYEEIDCLSPNALNHLKAEVTMRTVNERQVYRHFKECRPHIASFCATGNNVNFLTDSTGNRRWLAFEVESIDSPLAQPFDYEGIYSQVWSLYRQGEKFWFDGEEIEHINRRNEYFSAPCLEEELVSLYYCHPGEIFTAKLVSTAEILERINVGMKMPLSAKKIGMVMKRLGYERFRVRTGTKYRVHERTTQEIDDAKRAEISIADQEKGKPANPQTELPF